MPRFPLRLSPLAGSLLILSLFFISLVIVSEHARDFVYLPQLQAPQPQTPLLEDLDWGAPELATPEACKQFAASKDAARKESPARNAPHSLPLECDYCGPTDTICEKYGEHNLARSRAYEGTNSRLKRVIAKARRGEPITISVLGGSVTKGHGILDVESDNWTTKFFEFWNRTFPHPDNKLINGAVPAVTSDYYMACALEHIDENSDLIFLEMAINDTTIQYFTEAFEWLIRRLLKLPNRPAIVNAQIMALSFEKIATGGDIHLGLSGYYDIPTISLKNVIASHVLAHPELEREFFASTPDGVDLRHLNVNGHTMLADLVVAYFRRQICDEVRYQFMYEYTDPTGSMARLLPKYSTMEDLPRLRLYAHYNQTETTPDINPTCMSMNSKNKLKPVENKGWVEWSWKDKPYLVGKKPGDKITFEVQIHSLGAVIMSYLQSKTLGLGRLKCWLNDNVAGARYISGYWNVDGVNLLKGDQIIINAPPGKHLVHCEITQETDDPKGGTEFRIVAVTST